MTDPDYDLQRSAARDAEMSAADHEPGEVAARVAREVVIERAAEVIKRMAMTQSDDVEVGARQILRALADARLLGEATPVHVHHYDIEKHAEHFNEGYEAAVTQGLADDPTLAADWLAKRDAEVAATALEDAANQWTQGGWARVDLPKDRAAVVVAMAQGAGDQLRDRAARIRREATP